MTFTRRACLLLLPPALRAATTSGTDLAGRWRQIATATDGTVGAAAMHLGSGQHAALNGDERFPLASVCKLPIAANILAMVDEGKLRLDQPIEVLPQDICPGVSAVAERWPGRKQYPLTELLELMVVHSDNSAVDAFFRIGGGARAMAARFRQWRVEGIRIDRREEQIFLDSVQAQYPPVEQWIGEMYKRLMQRATPEARRRGMEAFLADARDTGTPKGTVHWLTRLFRGELLSKASIALLIEMLKATTTGPKRLKGLLPEGTIVAHKTGLAGTANSVNGATNDVGVIYLPKGALAIAVFLKGSTRSESVREQVIAQVARVAYDLWA